MVLPLIERLTDIRLIATDVDGTLTREGKFTTELLQAIDILNAKGIKLLLVTGRSAGWVSAVNNYLPVAGSIAENGGVYFQSNCSGFDFLTRLESIEEHRSLLAERFWELQSRYPQIEESSDNQFRITDWTFDVAGLTDAELGAIATQCQRWGYSFTFSTVQCHIKPPQQDKGVAIVRVLKLYFPDIAPTQIITVGDSPNDATMFDRALFPLSVGVANIQHYTDRLPHLPLYITKLPEVAGFCELVELLN
ncbi:HAD-IIB family hydrolase [Chamaesiphon minutus]|uniref:HAD-superfamily hydrolase, subfamily IIB n=1 Tax=Chamaesiphon minutus (strain ATCC 27169 / PCC 6605) TaxID=1173020 RepID=K9UCC0_CHAP6|nr:HAD family hydrolase [Chamaesiphon minutus]AFY92096.1 HAD-superfamily hydrolase, subfamily IIB [Chamaesiphon minutus PCC 6605]